MLTRYEYVRMSTSDLKELYGKRSRKQRGRQSALHYSSGVASACKHTPQGCSSNSSSSSKTCMMGGQLNDTDWQHIVGRTERHRDRGTKGPLSPCVTWGGGSGYWEV